MIAVSDTCFLIDWARFSRRDLLFRIFDKVLVPKQILDEVKSLTTVEFVSSYMASGSLVYFEPIPSVLEEADQLVRESYELVEVRRLDLPEAICLVMGKRFGYVVLTENLGALILARRRSDLRSVVVWRSLEVLAEACRRGIFGGEPTELFQLFSGETKHVFNEEELRKILEELSVGCDRVA